MKLKEKYKIIIIKKLFNKFKYTSIMQVPKIRKIVISTGIGKFLNNKNKINDIINDLSLITSQKPFLTKAKKSISGFKIRKNQIIGCKVTLRKNRMWDFLEKLIYITIPRIRDFRGFSLKSFDKYGNFNIGIKDNSIFSEIIYKDSNKDIKGLNISINIIAKNNNESSELLLALNFPLLK